MLLIPVSIQIPVPILVVPLIPLQPWGGEAELTPTCAGSARLLRGIAGAEPAAEELLPSAPAALPLAAPHPIRGKRSERRRAIIEQKVERREEEKAA